MLAKPALIVYARLTAGFIVMTVWSFTVSYNTVYDGSTSFYVHVGAGIVLAGLFPGGFETVKDVLTKDNG